MLTTVFFIINKDNVKFILVGSVWLYARKLKMTDTVNSHHQSIELVERFAQCLLKDSKTPQDIALVKQLAPYIAYFNNEIQMSIKRDQIFDNFINMIEIATEKPDCDHILNQFQDEIEKAKKQLKSGEKCEKYINFMKMISECSVDSEDGDIKTISETVSTIDPISKLPIVEPVRNKKCGHSYDKSSILQLIEKNPRTRCPIAGCSASDFVRKSDLVPDTALKRMLSSSSSNSQKKIKLQD